MRWIRKPVIRDQDRCCFFVTYAPKGLIPPHSLFHARSWCEQGFKTVVIVVVDDLLAYAPGSELDFAHAVCIRSNQGYDFGAWAAVISQTPDIARLRLLALANDSVYGPFGKFPAMLRRAEEIDADVIGVTESYQITHHLQSYMLFFRQPALRNPDFFKFWRGVKTGGREFVIQNYELKLMARMQRMGLRTAVLFPLSEEDCNPTLKYWRELVQIGFPFIKAQLLRDNPAGADLSGWETVVRAEGFDAQLIHDHLGARIPSNSSKPESGPVR
jgi:lipopolysaccharide biosynthesis protein